ncbi:5-(carboxyamino)imidazole ribonucleotide synthase [Persicirhabdus sediminis]|uniref:N5-carboxyaminoimidazole ribonucleotide synthase n=1 Tax=Persicirhabdus sediminis TaxID=454144 RepID=A0A8J7SFP3_9BACT|nr:5-(carboxyamino)imidazole ribonucleotide synthase [Persicirhabdus sediminis]MBK1789600.1 5-(carboxyamino)imidazole ribonucleotide synthase [Persicirhabdus sediminis]
MSATKRFQPGSTIGIVGGGQLGMMLAVKAKQYGYKIVVWTGGSESPAAKFADATVDGAYDDPASLAEFVAAADFATVEFENLPVEMLRQLEQEIPLSPNSNAIYTCQRRDLEKTFLRENNIPRAMFELVHNADELAKAVERVGAQGVLKTASFGYDGKGQQRLHGGEDLAQVWQDFGSDCAVFEQWVQFEKELSIMVARDAEGNCVFYDPAENVHRHHILDHSIVPARASDEVMENARQIAQKIVEALDYQGIMGVEFFLKADGQLVVNEMAPRPHNSGHHTMDACETSQFEQQLRAVAGLSLGSTRLLSPVVMLNLLSDVWKNSGDQPDWNPLWDDGSATLHLYGKAYVKGRRKLGHVNFLAKDGLADPLDRAKTIQQKWFAEV